MKKLILILTFLMMSASCAKLSQVSEETSHEPTTLVGQPEIQSGSEVNPDIKLADALSEYNYLDPQHFVPTEPLSLALRYFKTHKSMIENQKYITVIDMSQKSNTKRLFVINMATGTVGSYLVAHGKNSDSNNNGYAEKFSNTEGSEMTSLGFYLTDETYQGAHGLSLRLRGLERTNSNAYVRTVVMHGADYVNPVAMGRSWGCPAIEMKYIHTLIPALKGKSLLYIYKSPARTN